MSVIESGEYGNEIDETCPAGSPVARGINHRSRNTNLSDRDLSESLPISGS